MLRHPDSRSGSSVLGLSCLGCLVASAVGGVALLGIGILVVALVGDRIRQAGPKEQAATDRGQPTKKAPTKTELEQLVEAHRINEADARRKYADVPVTVTGVVKSFDRHTREEQGGFVMLDQVEGIKSVVANFKPANVEQAAALPLGQRVTIRGKYQNAGTLKNDFVLFLVYSDVVPVP